MKPTGTLRDNGGTLVLTRDFTTPIDDVWASITESDRLARWFGTWDGDPASGAVMVTMNAEAEPIPPTRYDIHRCEPPRTISVSSNDEYGQWRLTADLVETSGGTTLTLLQEEVDSETLHETGPGWEWYLDRLVASVHGNLLPTLDDFDSRYMQLSDPYREMAL